ncbi:MAG: DUF507 family protein [Candidatus Angelobacter sp.]
MGSTPTTHPKIPIGMIHASEWFSRPICYTILFNYIPSTRMLFSKEYVGYLARQVAQKLTSGEFIETRDVPTLSQAVNAALLEELQVEDRINDEVRLILEQIDEELRTTGASYQEMFKKIKNELVRKYKVVL